MEKYCPKCFRKFSGDVTRCPHDNKKLIALTQEDLVGRELDDRYKVYSLPLDDSYAPGILVKGGVKVEF